MQKLVKHKIVIVGCGNVAWHLAKQFCKLREYEVFVYNHKPNVLLKDFKAALNCVITPSIERIRTDADIYFICVTDKAISETAKKIHPKSTNSLIIHTSGSAKLKELGSFKNAGVFYPLQTFSKKDEINWQEIPVIIEARNQEVKNKILILAKKISKHIIFLSYKDRLKLHLAAVLVNNFTNALFVVAEDLLPDLSKREKTNLLIPLIKQTVLKAERLGPLASQTGPAKRNDEVVMKKHLKLLNDNADLKKIYKQMSLLIVKQQTKRDA